MKKLIPYLLAMPFAALFIPSCTKNEEPPKTPDPIIVPIDSSIKCNTITFDAHINRIFVTNCGNCHMGANNNGGINFEGYAKLKAAVETGKVWGAINHSTGFKAMPPGGNKINKLQLDSINCWRGNGYKQN